MRIPIALAEDKALFREGVKRLINSFADFEVVLACENGKELTEKMSDQNVKVALVDYRMPEMNGLETVKYIRENFKEVKVLILSLYDDDEFVMNCISNGAHGYLTKDAKPEEIKAALEAVVSVGYYLDDRTSKLLISNAIKDNQIHPEFLSQEELSPVEKKVIELICKEYTNKEISEKIFKSTRTVESYRRSIMNKIGAKNTAGIVMYAVKNNLVHF